MIQARPQQHHGPSGENSFSKCLLDWWLKILRINVLILGRVYPSNSCQTCKTAIATRVLQTAYLGLTSTKKGQIMIMHSLKGNREKKNKRLNILPLLPNHRRQMLEKLVLFSASQWSRPSQPSTFHTLPNLDENWVTRRQAPLRQKGWWALRSFTTLLNLLYFVQENVQERNTQSCFYSF